MMSRVNSEPEPEVFWPHRFLQRKRRAYVLLAIHQELLLTFLSNLNPRWTVTKFFAVGKVDSYWLTYVALNFEPVSKEEIC
jgi:hypothetical protein